MRPLIPLLLCLGCSPAPPPVAQASLVETLPETARGVLRPRMARHGEDIAALYHAVGQNDLDAARGAARRIADEPRLARPLDPADLNALIPELYFDLQEALRKDAERLAHARSTSQAADAFESLTTRCRGCHAVFFDVPGDDPAAPR